MTTRRHAHESFERLSCENGITEERVIECVQAVRMAECPKVDALGQIPACGKAMCAR